MNIFYLDHDPKICAQYHCDKHVVKLILESAQLLETAHIVAGHETPYSTGKKGWSNHPCAKWVRESYDNYLWLCSLGHELCLEYTHRYGKVHAYQDRFAYYRENAPQLPEIGFTAPFRAVGDKIRAEVQDSVTAYRVYYNREKHHFCKWTKRAAPGWFSPEGGCG